MIEEALDGKVYHYRDKNNLECDAVVHLRNGSYGLIEVKIGGADLIKEGAASLKALSDKIDTTKMKRPSQDNVKMAFEGCDWQIFCVFFFCMGYILYFCSHEGFSVSYF